MSTTTAILDSSKKIFTFTTKHYRPSIDYDDGDLFFSWEPRLHVPDEIARFSKHNGVYFDDEKHLNCIELFDGKIGFFDEGNCVRINQTDERIKSLQEALDEWYQYAIETLQPTSINDE